MTRHLSASCGTCGTEVAFVEEPYFTEQLKGEKLQCKCGGVFKGIMATPWMWSLRLREKARNAFIAGDRGEALWLMDRVIGMLSELKGRSSDAEEARRAMACMRELPTCADCLFLRARCSLHTDAASDGRAA